MADVKISESNAQKLQEVVEPREAQPLSKLNPGAPVTTDLNNDNSEEYGQEEMHFDVHASVIFQLGESLISDEIQALIELIKNSYDANASYANLVINTTEPPPNSKQFSNSIGFVSIEDDGDGMDRSDIKRGWLTISNSLKRELKQKQRSTGSKITGRIPLGDKGLGRLGVQRLGRNLEMWTKTHSGLEHHVAIAWGEFALKALLSEIPVIVESAASPIIFKGNSHGTRLVVSGLSESAIQLWRNALKGGDFRTRLSEMISPYREVAGFRLIITVDGQSLDLADITDSLRNTAQLHYDISFNEEVVADGQNKPFFRSTGFAKLELLKPREKEDAAKWNHAIEADGGYGIYQFLKNDFRPGFGESIGLERVQSPEGAPSDLWFVKYSFKREFGDFAGLHTLDDGQIANPGSFVGMVDAFNLSADFTKRQQIFDRASQYKQLVKALNGIRIYRDGFRVRVDQDWLRLGGQQTSGGSYYGLRPENSIGYIAISAQDNSVLEETTDREGFKETPYYANFFQMLRQWVSFTERAQEFLRRGVLAYFKQMNLPEVASRAETAEEIAERVTQTFAAAQEYARPLQDVVQNIDRAISDAQRTLIEAKSSSSSHSNTANDSPEISDADISDDENTVIISVRQFEQTFSDLQSKANDARQKIDEIENYLKGLSDNVALGQVLTNQIEVLREQLAEVYETVSLGLTAELISHDMQMVTAKLSEETRRVRQNLKKRNVRDIEVGTYLANVDSSINALLKQLSRLTPALRFMRERRDEINLLKFFDDQREYFRPRFDKRSISMEFALLRGSDFHVRMNRGKLAQVIDNILLNSEYWLSEEIRLGRIKGGLIRVELAKPFIRISDNGPGFDPSIEGIMFEPFITTKPREQGRGLGLFIVQQLLDSDGCTIGLTPQRNARGRHHTIEIDLSNVLLEK